MANSCVRGAMRRLVMRLHEGADARCEKTKTCVPAAERQHQRELRPVDEEAGGKLPAAAAAERRRPDPSSGAPVAGRSEKIVPIETLVSMLDEPSSGSMARASARLGVEQDRRRSSSSEA